jgi:hypothetical protein
MTVCRPALGIAGAGSACLGGLKENRPELEWLQAALTAMTMRRA